MTQWFILQHEVTWASAWMWVSPLGLAAGLAVGAVAIPLATAVAGVVIAPVVGVTLSAALAGLIYGMAQREVLRGRVDASGLWVVATTTAMIVAFSVAAYVSGLRQPILAIPAAAPWTGLFTGPLMMWMLRRAQAAS